MSDGATSEDREPEFHIQIDEHEYVVHQREMTGEELRHVPPTPIPQDQELYEVVPGEKDRLIRNDQVVTIRDGLRFVTAPREFHIQIDRHEYTVHQREMTGEELRHVPPTPIPQDRDLYEVVPGEEDRLIRNDQVVTIRDGLRFFTAPHHINPGAMRSII